MNKKLLVPSIASISICSLALCNCSTISSYRKDPSDWDKPAIAKPKVEKISKKITQKTPRKTLSKKLKPKKKRGGLLGFITKYRKNPSEWDNSNNKPNTKPSVASVALVSNPRLASPNVVSPTFSRQSPPVSVVSPIPPAKPQYKKQPNLVSYPTLPTRSAVQPTPIKTKSITKGERRKIGGLLNPDADKLPTRKDLQEIQSAIPNSSQPTGVKIPIKP